MHMHVRRLEKLPLGALREHERRGGEAKVSYSVLAGVG